MPMFESGDRVRLKPGYRPFVKDYWKAYGIFDIPTEGTVVGRTTSGKTIYVKPDGLLRYGEFDSWMFDKIDPQEVAIGPGPGQDAGGVPPLD